MMGMASNAQDNESLAEEVCSSPFLLRQKPGTERMLAEWLRDVPADRDTIYAVLYEPGLCPRCEIGINSFYDLLKMLKPSCRYTIISAYPDSATAAAYNRKKGYKADHYLYDTDGTYKKIFSLNYGALAGQYLLKLCKSKGELVVSSTSSWMTLKFASELVKWTERIETHDFSAADTTTEAPAALTQRPVCRPTDAAHTDRILDTGGQKLSEVKDVPKFDGRYFYFNDELAYAVMLFEEHGDTLRLKGRIEADSAERRRFIHVSEEQYRSIPDDALFYMPLTADMPDSGRICVSYSLPLVFQDTCNKEQDEIVFMNYAALISRDVNTLKPLPVYVPQIDTDDPTFFTAHFTFCIFKGDVIYNCQKKTFPMDGFERDMYEHTPALNPFRDAFYYSGNPWLAAYSLKTGRLTGRYGELEPCSRASRTGYWFRNNIMYSHGGELLCSDGYSGTIRITDNLRGGKVQTYSAFSVDTAAFPKPDTTLFYKHEYLQTYNRFYYRQITAARMDSAHVYCIVRYGADDIKPQEADHTFVTIDRRTGMGTEQLLPHADGWQTMGFGLRTSSGRVTPFGFYRRADGGYVVREWTGGN